MALTKTPTQLFVAETIPGNTYTSASAGFDLTDAVDFAVGYTMTFNADADVGATIYLFGDPSASNIDFVVASYDNPVDACPIDGFSKKGRTVSGVYRMDHSTKYGKLKVYNHDSVSITNCYVWIIPQK